MQTEKLRVITRSVITRNYFVITRSEIHYTKGVEKQKKKHFQLNSEWEQGDVAGQQAKWSNYFDVGGDERPTPGKWFYVKSSRSATSLSSRASRRRSRGEGGEESKGGSDDEQEQEEEGDGDSDA